ncbi:MAG: hypothetical protein ACR2MP_28500 [Streptosporangiaceae bacterium]
MRVIVRKERPHPGAQLRFTGIDGHRFTCFATSTNGGHAAEYATAAFLQRRDAQVLPPLPAR